MVIWRNSAGRLVILLELKLRETRSKYVISENKKNIQKMVNSLIATAKSKKYLLVNKQVDCFAVKGTLDSVDRQYALANSSIDCMMHLSLLVSPYDLTHPEVSLNDCWPPKELV